MRYEVRGGCGHSQKERKHHFWYRRRYIRRDLFETATYYVRGFMAAGCPEIDISNTYTAIPKRKYEIDYEFRGGDFFNWAMWDNGRTEDL